MTNPITVSENDCPKRLLTAQILQNVLRTLFIVNTGHQRFTDEDIIIFSESLKHNSSILFIHIEGAPLTDVSLKYFCKVLKDHVSIRGLYISGTKATSMISSSIRELACENTGILYLKIEDPFLTSEDAEIIDTAVRYNGIVFPDPLFNPFSLAVINEVSQITEAEEIYRDQVGLVHSSRSFLEAMKQRGKEPVLAFRSTEHSIINQRPCAHYLAGSCRFGALCKLYHPERTNNQGVDSVLFNIDLASYEAGLHNLTDSSSTKPSDARNNKEDQKGGRMGEKKFCGMNKLCQALVEILPSNHDVFNYSGNKEKYLLVASLGFCITSLVLVSAQYFRCSNS